MSRQAKSCWREAVALQLQGRFLSRLDGRYWGTSLLDRQLPFAPTPIHPEIQFYTQFIVLPSADCHLLSSSIPFFSTHRPHLYGKAYLVPLYRRCFSEWYNSEVSVGVS